MEDSKNIDKEYIHIKLTRKELNIVIESLTHLPFRSVYKIIEKIHIAANKLVSKK